MDEENTNPEVQELPVEDGTYTEEIITPEMVSTKEIPDTEEDLDKYKEQESIKNAVEGGL